MQKLNFGFLFEWFLGATAAEPTLEFAAFLPFEALERVVSFGLSAEFLAPNVGVWLLRNLVRCRLHTLTLAFLDFSVRVRLVRLPIGLWLRLRGRIRFTLFDGFQNSEKLSHALGIRFLN